MATSSTPESRQQPHLRQDSAPPVQWLFAHPTAMELSKLVIRDLTYTARGNSR
jgi:hypothetical protein